ncbi:MAG TPA: acetate/propionate family kinase [Marmoricola sp.]|nr:acetate/propionate family kinase [Marmoricola sp.]
MSVGAPRAEAESSSPERVLVVNAGSSSLKLAVLEGDRTAAATTVERWQGVGHVEPIEEFLAGCGVVDAVGHRVVHGGARYSAPVVVDDDVVAYLDSITDLAPLHQPRVVAGLREVSRLVDVPSVACFDTAFHATLGPAARTYALPREWNHRWDLRRYGFHGLSHASAVRRAAEIIGRPLDSLRIVSCHLGAGASLAAVRDGRSVDTTMGFTPLAGLVMQTRSGSVDPGLVMWLLEHGGLDSETLTAALEHQSGLRGLTGTSGDIREVLDGRARGDADCVLAFDVYMHTLVREIGAMAATAGGLDLLVFTGGVGEHSPDVRAAAAERLAHLDVALDPDANAAAQTDADITAAGAKTATVVVTAAEAAEVARLTRQALARDR